MYAANFLTSGNVEDVASELYAIMEASIDRDSYEEQETTKEFLVLIIQFMNDYDKVFTEEVTKTYLEKTSGLQVEEMTAKEIASFIAHKDIKNLFEDMILIQFGKQEPEDDEFEDVIQQARKAIKAYKKYIKKANKK